MKQNPISLEGTLVRNPRFLFLYNGRQGVGFTVQLDNKENKFVDVEINGSVLHKQKKSLLKNTQVSLMGNIMQRCWTDKRGFLNSKYILACNKLEIK